MTALVLAALLLQSTDATLDRDYDKAAALLPHVRATPATYNHVEYLRAVVAHGTGDRAAAELHANHVLDSFHPIERRHEIVCELILRDTKTWKDGDLGDIDRLMVRAADKLHSGRAPKAIPIQDEIIRKLDRMIQEQEDQKSQQQQQAQGQQAPQPQSDSRPADDTGAGKITEKTFAKIRDNWGTMPEADRAKVVDQISRDIPDKYKLMVEQYLKSLSRK